MRKDSIRARGRPLAGIAALAIGGGLLVGTGPALSQAQKPAGDQDGGSSAVQQQAAPPLDQSAPPAGDQNPSGGNQAAGQATVADAAFDHGLTVFMGARCYICHGEQGFGGAGPRFRENRFLGLADYVIGQILVGRKIMPSFAQTLNDEQIAAVATYVRNAWGNEFGPVDPGQVALARQKMQLEPRPGAQQELPPTAQQPEGAPMPPYSPLPPGQPLPPSDLGQTRAAVHIPAPQPPSGNSQ